MTNPFNPQDSDASQPHIFFENVSDLDVPADSDLLNKAVNTVSNGEHVSFALVEFILVDDEVIKTMNTEYLQHHYITDVITFPYHEWGEKNKIEGTIYACAHQIKRQARQLNEPQQTEYARIILHGLLHLCGYNDSSKEEKNMMRKKENFYLKKLGL